MALFEPWADTKYDWKEIFDSFGLASLNCSSELQIYYHLNKPGQGCWGGQICGLLTVLLSRSAALNAIWP